MVVEWPQCWNHNVESNNTKEDKKKQVNTMLDSFEERMTRYPIRLYVRK